METPKKVAVIHRQQPLIDLLCDVFRQLGYIVPSMHVHARTTPYEVATFVSNESPDLLLIAESFEGGSKRGEGLEAAVEIKKQSPNLPIGLISGNPQYRARARELGLVDYLPMSSDIVDKNPLELYGQFLKQILES